MPLGVDIPVNEVKRYMGYHGDAEITPDIEAKIDKAIEQVSSQSHPRIVMNEYLIDVTDKTVVIHTGKEDLTLESESLCRNLSGCRAAILLAATIGPSCDMLVRRAVITSSADAAMYQAAGAAIGMKSLSLGVHQAAGAAAIEAFLDSENDRLKKEYEARDLYLRPRFSPGYGDLKLDHQKDWFRLLDISKQIGIELTDSLLMVPTKSVTAIIGIGGNIKSTCGSRCGSCNMHNTCEFSKGRT